MIRRSVALVLLAACALPRSSVAAGATPGALPAGAWTEPASGDARVADVRLQQRLKDLPVVRRNGRLWVDADPGPAERLVDGEAFLRALHAAQVEQQSHGFLYGLFNISKPWGFAWIAVGFLGQALFTARMLLQWWASERVKRSVIPVGFWWGSLGGGLLLLVYFAWRQDIVGILGQSTGLVVYARNLMLIHARARAADGERAAQRAGDPIATAAARPG